MTIIPLTAPDLLRQIRGLAAIGVTALEVRDRDERVISTFELRLLAVDRPIGFVRPDAAVCQDLSPP